MKLIVRLWLVVMALTVFGGMAEAQNHRQRITRERLAEAQARHMAEEMHLDSEACRHLLPLSEGNMGSWASSQTGKSFCHDG